MRAVRRLGLLALVLATVLAGVGAEAAPVRRALLIGINDYVKLPDLRGALNDLEIIRDVLVSRHGFAAANITTVTDQGATRQGILAAFTKLAEVTGPEDVVYIHYSGHGSQARDANQDDTDDRMDETIVPHDGRTPNVPDITDDELGQALRKIRAKQVVIVLDSCHSGTATRGITTLRARAVPADDRDALYARTATRAVVPISGGSHLLMTGAANDEEALDGPVDGRPHGLFTFSLAQALKRSAASASPRELFQGVAQEQERIKAQLALRNMPEPQLEADAARLDGPIFGAAVAAPVRVAWVPARAEAGGRVRLVGAARAGAQVGSQWALYPADETAFAPGKAQAVARVLENQADDSLAELDPKAFAVPAGARATQVSAAPAPESVRVILLGDAARSERLRAALAKQVAGVQFARQGEFARFVIEVTPDGVRVLGADAKSEVAALAGEDDAALAEKLAALLRRSMTASELLAIDNPGSTLRLTLAVPSSAGRAAPARRNRSVAVVADGRAPRFAIRKPGEPRSEKNSLQLTVTSSARCYLTVVDVDVAGGVHVLFPNAISEGRGYFPKGLIEPDAPLLIPDSLQSGNRAGFFVDYAPPAGTDTLRAFCAADLGVADLLRRSIATLDTDAGTSRAAARSVLGVELRDRLAKIASRGMRLVADEPEPPPSASEPETPATPSAPPPADWVAASLTIIVED